MKTPFLFVADHRALDFLNTEVMMHGRPADLLTDFAALVEWLRQAGAVDEETASEARARWLATQGAGEALRLAKELRAGLRRIVLRRAGVPAGRRRAGGAEGRCRAAALRRWGGDRSAADLEPINRVLREGAGFAELAPARSGFARRFRLRMERPAQLLAPIADAAADLLCNADFRLVRPCGSRRCILLFYDRTRNHARRWCSMRTCGNRQKAALHRQRRRAAGALRGSPP